MSYASIFLLPFKIFTKSERDSLFCTGEQYQNLVLTKWGGGQVYIGRITRPTLFEGGYVPNIDSSSQSVVNVSQVGVIHTLIYCKVNVSILSFKVFLEHLQRVS